MKNINYLLLISLINLGLYIKNVSYNYGYMQSAIDYNVAAFSSPSYVAIFSGMYYLLISLLFFIIYFILKRKKM